MTKHATWSRVGKSAGTGLLVLAALGTLLFAFAHLGSYFIGTRLETGDEYEWTDSTIYVNALDGATNCAVDHATDSGRSITIGVYHRKNSVGDRVGENLKPGGEFLSPSGTGTSTLTCRAPVRVGSGWYVHLYRPIEGGFWTVMPIAAAFAAGAVLRRGPTKPRWTGDFLPPR